MMDDTRTCNEWRALMADALAGECGPADSRRLERHLETCEECAAVLQSLRTVWHGLAELPQIENPPEARAALLQRAHAEMDSSSVPPSSDHATSDQAGSGIGKNHDGGRGAASPGPQRVSGSATTLRWMSRAAVIVLVFAGGLVAGRSQAPAGSAQPPPAGPDESRYLLLLHENASFLDPPVHEAVAEYGAWAEELGAKGRLAAAEKLTDDGGMWLTGPEGEKLQESERGAAGDAEITPEAVAGRASGFFIVSARSDSAAARIAATMPHLKYGGTVQIRQIEEIDN